MLDYLPFSRTSTGVGEQVVFLWEVLQYKLEDVLPVTTSVDLLMRVLFYVFSHWLSSNTYTYDLSLEL